VSIVESLRKLVDPVQAKAEEQERKRAREQPLREAEGGRPQDEPASPPLARCRVCGREDSAPRFCPECLAETMVPLPGR
jgi:rubrerythrin